MRIRVGVRDVWARMCWTREMGFVSIGTGGVLGGMLVIGRV